MTKPPYGSTVHSFELFMGHGEDDGIVAFSLWLLHEIDPMFVLGFLSIRPGIMNLYMSPISFQSMLDIGDPSVANVGAVFFESDAKNQNAGATDGQMPSRHQLDDLIHHVIAHVIIDAASGQNHFRTKADFLSLMPQVVGVDANAVPPPPVQGGTAESSIYCPLPPALHRFLCRGG